METFLCVLPTASPNIGLLKIQDHFVNANSHTTWERSGVNTDSHRHTKTVHAANKRLITILSFIFLTVKSNIQSLIQTYLNKYH